MDNHKFWKTQPINQTNQLTVKNGPLKNLTIEELGINPLPLPEGFSWYTFDLTNDKDMDDLHKFLYNYYADTGEDTIKLAYTKETLKWFLQCPGYYPEFHIAVKYKDSIVGTIFGVPRTIKVFDKTIKQIEINYLCVREQLRSKRLAPILIKEVTRRVVEKGMYQAYYTASMELPNTLGSGTYYSRYFNIKKMIDANYTSKPEKISIDAYSRLFKVNEPTLKIRKMEEKDVSICCKKLNQYNTKYKISILFDEEEFTHKFLPIPNVVDSYVIENNNEVTDFISFFYIPLQILNNPKVKELKGAYIHYYFNESVNLKELVSNCFYLLKQNNVDLLSCINQMDNEEFFDELKFRVGGAGLHYYLFNWECPSVTIKDIALITI